MPREPSDMCVEPETEAGSRPVVLLVEDEVLIRIDVAEQLRAADLVVREAADAEEALTVLSSGAWIDVVVSDIDLPGTMDGLQLISVVRERHPEIKLIVCSGHITSQDDLPSSSGDIDAYFAKPLDCDQVAQRIRHLLEQAK